MKDFDSLKIAVAGTGYVGLSLATLLKNNAARRMKHGKVLG